jgi:hypothetical protein
MYFTQFLGKCITEFAFGSYPLYIFAMSKLQLKLMVVVLIALAFFATSTISQAALQKFVRQSRGVVTVTLIDRMACGDMNGDGRVDVSDAIFALHITVGIREPNELQLVWGDINSDGMISVLDVVTILQFAVGVSDHLSNCGK